MSLLGEEKENLSNRAPEEEYFRRVIFSPRRGEGEFSKLGSEGTSLLGESLSLLGEKERIRRRDFFFPGEGRISPRRVDERRRIFLGKFS